MKHTGGSYWCVPGRHTTTERGYAGLRLAESQELSRPTRNKELTWISHPLPHGVVFVFCFCFFNLLRKQESTFVTFESSVVQETFIAHFGPDPVPKKWRGHVPRPQGA